MPTASQLGTIHVGGMVWNLSATQLWTSTLLGCLLRRKPKPHWHFWSAPGLSLQEMWPPLLHVSKECAFDQGLCKTSDLLQVFCGIGRVKHNPGTPRSPRSLCGCPTSLRVGPTETPKDPGAALLPTHGTQHKNSLQSTQKSSLQWAWTPGLSTCHRSTETKKSGSVPVSVIIWPCVTRWGKPPEHSWTILTTAI